MSQTIDSKVVEMKFDNQNFEKNVSQSMNSIDKLKSKLDFSGTESKASKSIGNISKAANNFNMSGMEKAIETINYRFSTMGIVATNVLNQITTHITGKLVGAFNMVIGQIKSGGLSRAMNLERANFQLENLVKNSEKQAVIMKNVNDAVDGTAYGLDAAAVVAAQLVASGAEGGEQLYKQLRAIAGVAAMTGGTYEEIGQIFTTVAGQGRLLSMQMNQLAFRGLNVAAVMSKQMGISESEFRDKVSKSQITFEQFADAMVTEFSEAAGKANETFDGALSNVKAALSRIGAKFYTPALEEARDMLNKLRVSINDVNKSLDPFINSLNRMVHVLSVKVQNALQIFSDGFGAEFKNGKYLQVLDNITKAFESFSETIVGKYAYINRTDWKYIQAFDLWGDNYIEILKRVARESNVDIDSLIEKYGSLENTLKTKWFTKDIFDKFIGEFSRDFTSSMDGVMSEINRNNKFAEYLERLKTYYKKAYKEIDVSILDDATGQEVYAGKLKKHIEDISEIITAADIKDKLGVDLSDEEVDQLRNFWQMAKDNQMNVTELAKQLNKEKLMSLDLTAEEAKKVQDLYNRYKDGSDETLKAMSDNYLNILSKHNRGIIDILSSTALNIGSTITTILDSIHIGLDTTEKYVDKTKFEHLKSLGIIKDGYIDILKSVAKEYDVDIDGMIKKYGSLESSLKTKWFTKDIFDDVSKRWIGSLEPIMSDIDRIESIGTKLQKLKEYYNSETKLLQLLNTPSAKVDTDTGIVISEDERREMLRFWEIAKSDNISIMDLTKQIGNAKLANIGYSQSEAKVVRATYQAYKYGVSILNEISNSLVDNGYMFKSMSEWIKDIIMYIEDMSKSISDWFSANDRVEKLAKTFSGFFAIIRIGFNILDGIGIILKSVLEAFGILGDTALDLSSGISELIIKFSQFIEESQTFQRVGRAVAAVIKFVSNTFKSLYEAIKNIFGIDKNFFISLANAISSLFEAIFGKSDAVVEGLEKVLNKLNEFISKIQEKTGIIQKFGNVIRNVIKRISDTLNTAFQAILKADIIGALTSGIIFLYTKIRVLTYGGKSLLSLIEGIRKHTLEFWSEVLNFGRIKDILADLDSALYQLTADIKADAIWRIAKAVALLAGSLAVLASIDSDGLGKALAAMTALSGIIFVLLAAVNRISLFYDKWNVKNRVKSGKGGLFGGITSMLRDASDAYVLSIKMATLGNTVLKLAGSIAILSLAYKKIAEALQGLDADKVGTSVGIFVISIVAIFGGLAAMLVITESINIDETEMKVLGNTLLKMSASIAIVAYAFKIIANAVSNANSYTELNYAIGIFVAVILALVIAMGVMITLTSKVSTTKLAGIAGVMLAMSASMVIMGIALAIIEGVVSKYPWQDTLIAVIAMAGMMAIAIGAVVALSMVMKQPIALAAIIAASIVLAILAASMLSVAVSLGIVVGALAAIEAALGKEDNHMWQALGYLAVVLITLSIGLTMLTTGIVGAQVLIMLGDALKVLVPIMLILAAIPTDTIFEGFKKIVEIMLGFAVVGVIVTLLSPLLLGLSVVLIAVGAGLALVAFSLAAFVLAFTAGASLVEMSSSVIIEGANRVADSVIAFLNRIIDGADTIIPKMYDSIMKNKDKLISIVGQLIDMLIQAVNENVPKLVDLIKNTIIQLSNQLHLEGVLNFIVALRDAVNKIFQFLADVINPSTEEEGGKTVESYGSGLEGKISAIVNKAIDIFVAFCNALADAVDTRKDEINTAIGKLARALTTAVEEYVKPAMERAAAHCVAGFIKGIVSKIGPLRASAEAMGINVDEAFNDYMEIKSPSKRMYRNGKYVVQGLINGMKQNRELISVSEDLGTTIVDRMQTALDTLQEYASRDYSIEPTITPVLDMSGTAMSAEAINNLLSGNASIGIAASVNAKLNRIQNESPYNDITRAINTLHNDLQELDANNYTINGVTYDDGSNVANAVGELISAVKVGRRA